MEIQEYGLVNIQNTRSKAYHGCQIPFPGDKAIKIRVIIRFGHRDLTWDFYFNEDGTKASYLHEGEKNRRYLIDENGERANENPVLRTNKLPILDERGYRRCVYSRVSLFTHEQDTNLSGFSKSATKSDPLRTDCKATEALLKWLRSLTMDDLRSEHIQQREQSEQDKFWDKIKIFSSQPQTEKEQRQKKRHIKGMGGLYMLLCNAFAFGATHAWIKLGAAFDRTLKERLDRHEFFNTEPRPEDRSVEAKWTSQHSYGREWIDYEKQLLNFATSIAKEKYKREYFWVTQDDRATIKKFVEEMAIPELKSDYTSDIRVHGRRTQ